MNKTSRILMLAAAFATSSITAQAVTVFGKTFTFKGDVKEWSEPIADSMYTDEMEKEGIAALPLTVRVRVVRKIFRGCRYEVEVTNNDPKRSLKYEANHNGKMKKHRIKAGETEVYSIDTFLDKNCPDMDACGNGQCEFAVRFFDVDVKA